MPKNTQRVRQLVVTDYITLGPYARIRKGVGNDYSEASFDNLEALDTASTVDISLFVSSTPADAAVLLLHIANSAFTLPASLTGSNAYANTASAAGATFSIEKNDVSIGTVDFTTAVKAAGFTFASDVSFAVGDRLTLVNQGTADTTLADISVNLRGTF
jgi:hypothetical protein